MYQPTAPAAGSGVLAATVGYSMHATWLMVLGFLLMTIGLMLYAQSRLFYGEYLARAARRSSSTPQTGVISSTFRTAYVVGTLPLRTSIRLARRLYHNKP